MKKVLLMIVWLGVFGPVAGAQEADEEFREPLREPSAVGYLERLLGGGGQEEVIEEDLYDEGELLERVAIMEEGLSLVRDDVARMSKENRTGGGIDDLAGLKIRGEQRDEPFGKGQIEVTGAPGHVTVVLLEVGERIESAKSAAGESWAYSEVYYGPDAAQTPALSFAPRGFGLKANYMIFTNRRLIRLKMMSPARPKAGATLVYDDIVNLVFPEEEMVSVGGPRPTADDAPPVPAEIEGGELETVVEQALTVTTPRRRKALPKEGVQGVRRGDQVFLELSEEWRERVGEWPQLQAYLGEEKVATNWTFSEEDGKGLYRLPMVPTKVEVFIGEKRRRKWLWVEKPR